MMSMNETFFIALFLSINSNTFDNREDKLKYRNDYTFENYLLKNDVDNTDSAFFSINFNFDFLIYFFLTFFVIRFYSIIYIYDNLKDCLFCSYLRYGIRNQLMRIYLINISNNICKNTFIILKFEVTVYEIRV